MYHSKDRYVSFKDRLYDGVVTYTWTLGSICMGDSWVLNGDGCDDGVSDWVCFIASVGVVELVVSIVGCQVCLGVIWFGTCGADGMSIVVDGCDCGIGGPSQKLMICSSVFACWVGQGVVLVVVVVDAILVGVGVAVVVLGVVVVVVHVVVLSFLLSVFAHLSLLMGVSIVVAAVIGGPSQ